MKKIVRAKLHGITITGADLNYHGSITLDPDMCEQAGILPMEFVEIWNKDSGARISTYVIYGEPGSKSCILNLIFTHQFLPIWIGSLINIRSTFNRRPRIQMW